MCYEAFEPRSCSVGVDELDDLSHCSCRALDVGPTLFERQTAVCSIVAVTETAKNAEAKGFNRNSCLGVFSDHHFWLNIVSSIDDSEAFEPHSCSVGA